MGLPLLIFASTLIGIAGLLTFHILNLRAKLDARVKAFRKLNPGIPVHTTYVEMGILSYSFESILKKFGYIFYSSWSWETKHALYDENDIIAVISPLQTIFYIADADLIKEISVTRPGEFLKPVQHYKLAAAMGENVVSTEGVTWRRHRKITAPQFSERNNEFVHQCTLNVMKSILSSWDSELKNSKYPREVEVDVDALTTKIALHVISGAAFGAEIEFGQPENLSNGHKLSFESALLGFIERRTKLLLFKTLGIIDLPFKTIKNTKEYYTECTSYIQELIEKSRNSDSKNISSANILTSLVSALQQNPDDVESTLSESELLGNIFVFLFAGHETTAHTLMYAIALLAINPEIQAKLHADVIRVVGKGELPSYKHFSQLSYAMAVMNETLRLFPQVVNLPRIPGTGADGLEVSKTIGGKWTIPTDQHPDPALAGSCIFIDFVGIHYNPRFWPKPMEFKPERFLGDDAKQEDSTATNSWNRSALLPFYAGPRACLGKKFAQVEFIAVLTMLSIHYTWRTSTEMGSVDQKSADAHLLDVIMNQSKPATTVRPMVPFKILFAKRE